MKVREMRTAGYSEESIQRIVALNEKNNWWRADELLPDVKEERRYPDHGGIRKGTDLARAGRGPDDCWPPERRRAGEPLREQPDGLPRRCGFERWRPA
eukprot:1809008-Pyramimonas_sp.AAC.1